MERAKNIYARPKAIPPDFSKLYTIASQLCTRTPFAKYSWQSSTSRLYTFLFHITPVLCDTVTTTKSSSFKY